MSNEFDVYSMNATSTGWYEIEMPSVEYQKLTNWISAYGQPQSELILHKVYRMSGRLIRTGRYYEATGVGQFVEVRTGLASTLIRCCFDDVERHTDPHYEHWATRKRYDVGMWEGDDS